MNIIIIMLYNSIIYSKKGKTNKIKRKRKQAKQNNVVFNIWLVLGVSDCCVVVVVCSSCNYFYLYPCTSCMCFDITQRS